MFRLYALVDLLEVKQIEEQLQKTYEIKMIDICILWAAPGQQTMLSKFSKEINSFGAIVNCPSIVDESKNKDELALRLPLVLSLRD